MNTPSLETSQAAAFAAALNKRFTVRDAMCFRRPPNPTMRFYRGYPKDSLDAELDLMGIASESDGNLSPDKENYLLFSDNSIFVKVGFGLPAAHHTITSLAVAIEARRGDGCPLPPALRELLIYVVNNEELWEEAEFDAALVLLATSDRDARHDGETAPKGQPRLG